LIHSILLKIEVAIEKKGGIVVGKGDALGG
jgi:hypothetical protein